ncbi:MAG TPA: TolC family protein [Gemmatimonadaceae bacterium]|nr:TolC family protein [Gemmatimonadaceae bacterium]
MSFVSRARSLRRVLAGGTFALAASPLAAPLRAQDPVAPARATGPAPRALSLADALRLAEQRSEDVHIAEAGVLRARGEQYRARSQLLPQLNASASYTRTLATQFEILRQEVDPNVDADTVRVPLCSRPIARDDTPAEVAARLADAASCPGADDGLARLFGNANQFNLGLTGSLNLFTGGRVTAGYRAANAGRRAADVELVAQRAQLQLTVAEAYYDAVLADRLATIAESSLVQTESALRQTRLARTVGNTSEFDLLRAQVTRDNQRPAVIQSRTQRELAALRLKQLLELPLDDSLDLTTGLQDTTTSITAVLLVRRGPDGQPLPVDTSADVRAGVRQAAENLEAQRAFVTVARAQRLPGLAVSTSYGRVAYPASGVPGWSDFLENWTVTVGASVPLFTGGRIRGDVLVARANMIEAEQRYRQARELATLDARSSIAALQEAEARFAASVGTTEQAARAYTIAEVRYREGLSTQLELSESRILMQQAQANRATAARNLQVARARLALLRDLPLSTGGAASAQGGTGGRGTQSGGQGGTGGRSTQQTNQQAGAQTGSLLTDINGANPGGVPQ